ncbi:class I SAM-dependent methyltransferase [Nonomuraea rubra]
MAITFLPPAVSPPPRKPVLENVPELQALARQVAIEGGWSPDLAQVVQALFDAQAATWNAEHSVGRFDPVEDALRRGGVQAGGVCLEVGSGTGQITTLLAGHFGAVVCIDLSADMLAQAAGTPGARVRGDASRLPLAEASVDAAVLVDTFCFADELDRVVAADGVVVWINLLGRDGPLYVPTAEVAGALPGSRTGVESTAGWGSWAVLRRQARRGSPR